MRPNPLVSRLLFRPTLLWTLLKTRVLQTEAHWSEIDGVLLLGALPTRHELSLFAELQIGGVINLCAEWPGHVSRYEAQGIEQLYLPTPDYTSPDLDSLQRAVSFIQRFAARGQRVYCHCKAGRGRSATVALAWLVHAHRISPAVAEQHIIERRPQTNRRLTTRRAVIEFCEQLAPVGC